MVPLDDYVNDSVYELNGLYEYKHDDTKTEKII